MLIVLSASEKTRSLVFLWHNARGPFSDYPGDFDGCWSVVGVEPSFLDPVLLDFTKGRAAQKAKYFGELFPAEVPEGISGKTFLDFFQTDKASGHTKGIAGIRIRRK